MISGDTSKFMTPIRTISGKVETIQSTLAAQSGTTVRLEGCAVGEALSVSLASNTVSDFTNLGTRPSRNLIDDTTGMDYITFTTNTGDTRKRFGWIFDLAPGTYAAHIELVEFVNASMNIYVVDSDAVAIDGGKTLISYGNPYAGVVVAIAENQRLAFVLSGTSFTKQEAENIFYNCWNIQVESGNLPTPYETYGEKPLCGQVLQYGKNIFDYTKYTFINYYWNHTTGKLTSSSGYSASYPLIPVAHLRGKTITLNEPLSEVSTGASGGMAFFADNTAESFIPKAGGNGPTYTVPENATYMGISIPRAFASGEAVMIEIGDVETEFETFKQPTAYEAAANGVVEGVNAYSVNTLCVPKEIENDITLTAGYTVEMPGDTYTSNDKIKSINIDRLGDGKFFGFGISQKATISLLDKDNTCGLARGDKLNIFFDDVDISPTLIIEDATRDEKTNELKVVAYDPITVATIHTIGEVIIPADYTIRELVGLIASFLSTAANIPSLPEFDLFYSGGANIVATDTLRQVLNGIAEATQTIYYVNRNNELIFKRLAPEDEPEWVIDRGQCFELTNKNEITLTGICSATELGDNVEWPPSSDGVVQYVRENPFWELRDDVGDLVQDAVEAVGGTSIHQFSCSWRGNYLLEPGDKINLIAKDGTIFTSYLINDNISYTGGYRQTSSWEYSTQEKEHSNAANLGKALQQTYARVDKVNQNIEIVASEASATASELAALKIDTGSITASVEDLQSKINDQTGEIETLTQKVEATITSDEVRFEIQKEMAKGTSSVKTSKGFSFSDSGLSISDSSTPISTTITENGMSIEDNGTPVLVANDEGVVAVDLRATTFLVIGNTSRLQDSNGRTACLWIGG